ncbi:MAG: hypothetical protein C4558_06025 [Dehalococcoidia bacterium]|nr:MAG: hypothetical protein C4558_06025 [Dehalococcoidia bacterium]
MPLDRITSALLSAFVASHGLDSLDEATQFEHFTAYLCMSRYLDESADIADTHVGAGNDTGVDAIGIIVNGSLVTDPDSVEELLAVNGYIEATFVFVQSDRSAGFETTKIANIGYGVSDFFADPPTLTRNEDVTAAAEVMAAVYKQSGRFRENPACKIFYVTTGKWTGDHDLEARRASALQDLASLGIFSTVEFSPLGADDIRELDRQSKSAISREFLFPSSVVVPDMPGVRDAYIGILPATEFVALLDDGEGHILPGLFYDNVRDWQDYNTVNEGMRTSLASEPERHRFVIMNNGITVIAKTLTRTGNRFHITDYQIVNGGQTSHVLFDSREFLDASTLVPLRLISTDDEEVIASIVRATNRQTEVTEDQLLALSDFQKQLEQYFTTIPMAQRLYYERRSRQYNSTGIEKTRIVTLQNLVRAYASMFLQLPHQTTRNYRALREQLGVTIFVEGHRLEPYYYAASALYRLEFLFRNGQLDAKFKPARYHILMAALLLAAPNNLPAANSHAMERFCAPLITAIWIAEQADALLQRAAEIVAEAADGNFGRDHVRTQPFTERVRDIAIAARAAG